MAEFKMPISSFLRKKEAADMETKIEKERRFDEAAAKIMPSWRSRQTENRPNNIEP